MSYKQIIYTYIQRERERERETERERERELRKRKKPERNARNSDTSCRGRLINKLI